MAQARWDWKQGDTKDSFVATLLDGNNAVVDLTDADTAKFSMMERFTGALAVASRDCEFVMPRTSGKVRYTPNSDGSDTETAGKYNGEIWVTWTDGSEQRFPSDRNEPYIDIEVVPKIA